MRTTTDRSWRRQRGSALTELAICLFPYCILLLGVVLIGQLALGKQEIMKSVAWAAPRPEAQFLEGEADKRFFFGRGEASFEETVPYDPQPEGDEEPVLPFTTENIEGAVYRAAFRVGQSTSIEEAEVSLDVSVGLTRAGRALQQAGLLPPGDLSQNIEVGEGEEIGEIDLPQPDSLLCAEVAKTLNSWLAFSRARAGFSYQLKQTEPLSAETLGGDPDRIESAEEFRGVYAMDTDAEDTAFALESASPDPEGFRGFHAIQLVNMEDFDEMEYDTDQGPVNPPDDPAELDPDLGQSRPEIKACWNPRRDIEE